MAITGKYQHYKNEDVEDYFIAAGVPYIGRKMMSMSSPLMEISLEGDVYTIKVSSLIRTVENKFKLGEEFDEVMPSAVIKSVTTRPSDNELTTTSILPENGTKSVRHYLFTDEECIVTLTHDNAKKPGKRYFKRMK